MWVTLPRIPGGVFGSIISRCLSKNQDERYADPSELLSDLIRICKNSSIPVRPKPRIVSRRGKELYALARRTGAVGKHQEAIEAARELVGMGKTKSFKLDSSIAAARGTGDDKNAIAAVERSFAIDETRSDAWNNFGVFSQATKKVARGCSRF